MRRLYQILAVVVFGAIIGGIVFLAIWDIPPPSSPTEIIIDNARL